MTMPIQRPIWNRSNLKINNLILYPWWSIVTMVTPVMDDGQLMDRPWSSWTIWWMTRVRHTKTWLKDWINMVIIIVVHGFVLPNCNLWLHYGIKTGSLDSINESDRQLREKIALIPYLNFHHILCRKLSNGQWGKFIKMITFPIWWFDAEYLCSG